MNTEKSNTNIIYEQTKLRTRFFTFKVFHLNDSTNDEELKNKWLSFGD